MNAIQTKSKIERLKVYITKTKGLISTATDPQKIEFFEREVRKSESIIEKLNK